MPYTPSGGYYERKPKVRVSHFAAGHPTVQQHLLSSMHMSSPSREARDLNSLRRRQQQRKQRANTRLAAQSKTSGYATLVCFAHPDDAKLFHRYMVEYARGVKEHGAAGIRIGAEVGYVLARATSVALHDCQKHPLRH